MRKETVEFNGKIYYRYPESPRRDCQVYFRTHGFGGRPRFLHRDVYEAAHGPIPAGHVVHHVDGNPLNNEPANLATMPMREHSGMHTSELMADPKLRARAREFMDMAREKANEWHRSSAGREWHSEHGRAMWVDRKPEPRACEQCGAVYETRDRSVSKFCSNNCKSAARRASGVDNVERECIACGGKFMVNRYEKTRSCSRVCGKRSADQTRARLQPDG